MLPAPLNQLSWACSIDFERSLSVVVIFCSNRCEKTGEGLLQNWQQALDRLHVSVNGQILRFIGNESLKKAEHRAHAKGKGSHVECRGVADFLSNEHGIVAEGEQDWLHAIE